MVYILILRKNTRQNALLLLLSLTCAHLALFRCEGFQTTSLPINSHHGTSIAPKLRLPTECHLLAEPPRQDLPGAHSEDYPTKNNNIYNRRRNTHTYRNNNIKKKNNRNSPKKEDVWSSGRWSLALQTESKLLDALEALQQSIKLTSGGDTLAQYPLPFPAIRDCNAALAAFGDGGDLLRALRLYFKMRKTASLSQRYPSRSQHSVSTPTPTLVTFSTIMSRAVYLGKPLVAIRLWNIMRREANFFSSDSKNVPISPRIVPDVKAANILMNCYAKLGDLDAAQDLLHQMNRKGGGDDVPRMSPNLVTYNTLLDACHNAGELDTALRVKEQLLASGMRSDTRTYTTLIATVARKASVASGANDPSLAFSFLEEMQTLDIRPNGMTYSALVDVCGRCRRSDLALKGLRLMLDQKAQEQKLLDLKPGSSYTLSSEVGAWTAAINACGKAGRIDTAVKLFYSMPNFGVYPNTVTCGCLTDCLLRNGRTADSLDVLRYMKKNRIAPSEVMYTSLMTSAGRLAQFENEQQNIRIVDHIPRKEVAFPLDDSGATKAVEVYTELMKSLMQAPKRSKKGFETPVLLPKINDDSNGLFKVSLVFQEMKAAGVEADLACCNAMLKSCANAGDVNRAVEVLEQIRASEEMDPNDNSWREMIRAAGKAGRVDIALSTWQTAVKETKNLSVDSLSAFLASLVRSAGDMKVDQHTTLKLYQLVVKLYEAVMSDSTYLGMNLVDRSKVLEDPRVMVTFLQGVVSLEQMVRSDDEAGKIDPKQLRQLAISIVTSECFEEGGLPYNLRKNPIYAKAFQAAQSWLNNEQWS
jgi:pentatricopeptide repeat protein